jgi:hypothetical protein
LEKAWSGFVFQGQARPTPSPIAERAGRIFDSSSDTAGAATCSLDFDSNFSINLSIAPRHWVRILIEGILVDMDIVSMQRYFSDRKDLYSLVSMCFSYPQNLFHSER